MMTNKEARDNKQILFPPITIQNEWCVVFCPLCHSSFPRKYILFGKRYCINPKCKNYKSKIKESNL